VLLAVFGVGILLIGVMAVLAIAGTRKYLSAAKSAEATNTIGEIAIDTTQAYERESFTGTLKAGAAVGSDHVLCASASHPVPASIHQVAAKKYMSSPLDWTSDPPDQGFTCLKFEMYTPQYYQYDYRRTGGATGSAVGDGFEAEAKGDLDGDGVTSSFKTTGKITSVGTLTISPTMLRVDETE